MAVARIFLSIFFIIFLFENSLAQELAACDSTTTFSEAGQVSYISWPETGNYKTFCTYIFKAPVDHFIRASVAYSLDGTPPSCEYNQFVAISLDNMPNWEGYSRFCGQRDYTDPILFQSIGNEFKIGISSDDFSKYVGVSIEVLPREQASCDCSWNPRRRIVGGVDAVPNEFVGHVAFKAPVGSFVQSFCGGTIITQYHAITAAHCIENINNVFGLERVIMRAGSHNVTAPLASDTAFAEEYLLASAVHHPNYKNPPNSNDIGIVTTTSYIRFTRGVGPACLPFSYQGFPVPDGTPLTAVGFGSTEYAFDVEYDTDSWILKKVSLYADSTLADDCAQPEAVCAVGAADGYLRGDTCTRDSGGPVYGYMKNRFFAFGVISRGMDCGSLSSYSYNMYMVHFLDWISEQLEGSTFLCDIR